MGGGDLNLKKSWHPSTLRNIERVWKAEQKHEAEQKKIEQLQRELADERAREEIRQYAEDKGVVKKKGDRLDWMYQGPAALVDREQYLTGRTIDKTFEVLQQLENKNQTEDSELTQPGAIFSQSTSNITVDLANKIREDPLFTIRKQETNQKKQLLNNPVKMKQLRELLAQSLETTKKKKNKKNKKKKKRYSGSSDDETRKSRKDKKHDKKNHKADVPIAEKTSPAKDGIPRQSNFYINGKQYGLINNHKAEDSTNDKKRISRSPNRNSKESLKSKPVAASTYSKRSTSYDRSNSSRRNASEEPKKRKKLDPEEAEKRCKEMMQDAKKWQEQREKNIKRYKEDDDKRDGKMSGTQAPDFIRPMLSKAATKGSVEARIKQKMYSIQRNSAAMDNNFARR